MSKYRRTERPVSKANLEVVLSKIKADYTEPIEKMKAESEQAKADAEEAKTSASASAVSAQESAASAAEAVKAAESAIQAELREEERVAAEAQRELNEQNRLVNEDARQSAENLRQTKETDRQRKEDGRQGAETMRERQEANRVTEERNRMGAETARESAETTRRMMETSRQQKEAAREQAEQLREAAERVRREADGDRQQTFEAAEAQREQTFAANESARQEGEAAREEAESLRQEGETARQEAETQRQQEFNRTQMQNAGAFAEEQTYRANQFNKKEAERDAAVAVATALTPKVEELWDLVGMYSDREPIALTLEESGKAINRAGVKVAKEGWAICSFIGNKGDVYSFDPGIMDNDVCIFSEEIVKKEYRPIEYKYTYDAEGLPSKATATYNGVIHSYTFAYEKDAEGHVTSETITDDQTGATLNALPYQYQSAIGTYHPLTILNASAELPLDHHCRLISHFQGEGTIRVTVSFNVMSADMNLLVFRSGLIANLATQLGTIFQMISESNKALSLAESIIESLSATIESLILMPTDDSALPLLCGQPPILFGAGTPQEAVVPTNWKQFNPDTGEGYNWNGEPSAIGQQYINTSASTGGRYIAVPSADGGLTWKNF